MRKLVVSLLQKLISNSMHEVLHSLYHVIGLCGEGHVKLVDMLPFYSYFYQNALTFAYTFKIPGKI